MTEIIDLTSSPVEARAPSPAPSIEITSVVKRETPLPPAPVIPKKEVDGDVSLKDLGVELLPTPEPCPLDELDDRTWATFDSLLLDAKRAAQATGFALVKRRASNYRNGQPTRYDLECSEGPAAGSGSKNPNPAKPRPSTKTQKKDCMWQAKATQDFKTSKWSFTMRHPDHCHPLDVEVASYLASNRRLDRTDDVAASIIRLAKQPKTSASDIASTVRTEFPGVKIAGRDVFNVLRGDKESTAGELTPTQQFVSTLATEEGVTHAFHREGGNPDGRIDRVFWTYDWCVEQLRKNPEVWSMDCTYKVNKFNMPLLQITGVTAMHTTFNIAYCLLSGEREGCFLWILQQLKTFLAAKDIPLPNVIITDFDKACKKAMRQVFGNVTQHQICVWHVMKNVAFNVRKKWVGSLDGTALGERGSDGSHLRNDGNPADDCEVSQSVAARFLSDADRAHHLGDSVRNPQLQRRSGRAPRDPIKNPKKRVWLDDADGILGAWHAVIYADTEEIFWEEWRTLKSEFPSQTDVTTYLLNTYIPMRHEFCHFAIKTYRNFGIKVTSRTEGSHGVLKGLLKSRNIHLNQLLDAVKETLGRLQEKYRANYAMQISKRVIEYSHKIFQNTRYHISFAGLDLIKRQLDLALEATANKRRVTECSGCFRVQFGLPCWHEILLLLRVDKALALEDLDNHWRLKPNQPLSETFLRIRREQDPNPVLNKRQQYLQSHGQVINGAQAIPATAHLHPASSASVRCDPSHDAPPPPAKRAKRMTAAQAVIQTQAEIQGFKDVASSLLHNLQNLSQRQTQLERDLMARPASQWPQSQGGWVPPSSQQQGGWVPPSAQQQGFSFQPPYQAPVMPSQRQQQYMEAPPAPTVYQTVYQSPLVQLSAQSQIRQREPHNPHNQGWHQ